MKHDVVVGERHWAPIAVPIVVALATILLWPGLFPIDDAYITLSNARVLVSGAPDSIYGSSYMTGATSPVHLLLVALVGLVVEPTFGLMFIGVVGALLYILGLARIAGSAGLTYWRRSAFLFIGGAWGYALFNYLNGLETSLAMAASAWLLIWRDDKVKLPILAGVAPFLRPELAVLGGLLILRLCLASRRSPIVAARMIGLAAIVALPWAVWVLVQTGQPMPSTMSAKLAFFREWALSPGVKVLVAFWALAVSFQLPFYVGLLGLKRDRWPEILFLLIGLCTALVLMPSSLSWNMGRYAAIFTPVLMVGIAALVATRSRATDLLLWLLSAGTVVTAVHGYNVYREEVDYARQVRDHARFVATLPSSAIVMIHDAGQVAWESPTARLIDVVGLKTPGMDAIHKELSTDRCEWGAALDVIARQSKATHVVVLERWDWPCLGDNLRDAGWQLNPIYRGLYAVYEMSPKTS